MYHKDGRSIPVSTNPDSIQRMKDCGFSEKKPVKKVVKKPTKKAE
tara:strand:- start:2690 stop:2824 length:135 start_codon:yes stop_codon:yes gene_type:complete